MKSLVIKQTDIPEIRETYTTKQRIYDYVKSHPNYTTQAISRDLKTYRQLVEQALKMLLIEGMVNYRLCECGHSRIWNIKK